MSSGETETQTGCALDRAHAFLMERRLDEAFAAYECAEQLGADPDACSGGRWEISMLRGEMERAWKESDAIRGRGGLDPHRFWDGTSLKAKRVMVRCLHGFGDTIQMLRYLPDLLNEATRVVLEVPPRLLPLVRSLALAQDERLEICTWAQDDLSEPPAWDTQIEVTELPYLFRTRKDDLPLRERYLGLPEAEERRVGEGMRSQALRVGLVWTAGEWNQERAISPELLRSLLRCPAEFWNLVQGCHRQSVRVAEMEDRLNDAEIFGEGVLPMAAVIANLDLVITTDTLAAHLAGALGRPVWVMLPYAADWRWMSDAERSPWYPSMRLFRQSSAGDWSGVLDRVQEALQGELARTEP